MYFRYAGDMATKPEILEPPARHVGCRLRRDYNAHTVIQTIVQTEALTVFGV